MARELFLLLKKDRQVFDIKIGESRATIII